MKTVKTNDFDLTGLQIHLVTIVCVHVNISGRVSTRLRQYQVPREVHGHVLLALSEFHNYNVFLM